MGPLTVAKLKPSIQYHLEILDQAPASATSGLSEEVVKLLSERRTNSLQKLYLLSMGEYELIDGEEVTLKEKRSIANKIINSCDGLKTLCLLYKWKVEDVASCEEKGLADCNLGLEHEFRITCNLLINFLLHNNEDDSVARAFTHLD